MHNLNTRVQTFADLAKGLQEILLYYRYILIMAGTIRSKVYVQDCLIGILLLTITNTCMFCYLTRIDIFKTKGLCNNYQGCLK